LSSAARARIAGSDSEAKLARGRGDSEGLKCVVVNDRVLSI
jgi:hypothetical protein